MSTGKIELSVGAVKYVDTNKMITEEEYNYIKNKVPELDERVGIIEGEIDTIDNEIQAINSSLDNIENDLLNSFDIIPDMLRDSDSETDADLLQKAINLALDNPLETKQIKLNRKYIVDKELFINKSASWSNNSIHINIVGGVLELAYDGFMFNGIKNSGGITFTNTLFLHGSFTHTLFNCRNLIQLDFNHCQFKSTYTICEAEYVTENNVNDYIQSVHFNMCNFKGTMDYQLKAMRFFDVTLTQSYVEWGRGGFCKTYQKTLNNYSTLNCIIRDNVIEGISDQVPLKFNHSLALVIEGNYFEGNSCRDIEVGDNVNLSRGVTIINNFFGVYDETNKDCCIYFGASGSLIDLRNNKFIKNGIKIETTNQNGKFDVSGCNTNHNYSTIINYENVKRLTYVFSDMLRKKLSYDGNKIMIPLRGSIKDILPLNYKIDVTYTMTGSSLYTGRLKGEISFVNAYDSTYTSVCIKAILTTNLLVTNNSGKHNNNAISDIKVYFESTNKDTSPVTSMLNFLDTNLIIENPHSTNITAGYISELNKVMEYR